MTTYSIDGLPIPYRSAGASPLGTHEGTVTPPEPPTPTGTVYFSGKSDYYGHRGEQYYYSFDQSAFEHADKFIEKRLGDSVTVTVDGTPHVWAVTYFEEDSGWYDFIIADPQDPETFLEVQFSDGAATIVEYFCADEIPDGITISIEDPE